MKMCTISTPRRLVNMAKNITLLIVLFCALTAVGLFVSCGKDDDDGGSDNGNIMNVHFDNNFINEIWELYREGDMAEKVAFLPSATPPTNDISRVYKYQSDSDGFPCNTDFYLWTTGSVVYYYAAEKILFKSDAKTSGFLGDPYGAPVKFTTIDLSGFDLSDVKDMSNWFQNQSELTTIVYRQNEKISPTNMNGLFYGCKSLQNIDLSVFDTTNTTDMGRLFYGCTNLKGLDVSHLKTANVTDMSYMFNGCSSLNTLTLTAFDTTNVTTMTGMFYDCSNLTALDVSTFNTAKVTSMTSMFRGCSKITTLDISSFTVSSDALSTRALQARLLTDMFRSCTALTTIYAKENTDWSLNDGSDASMFTGCTNLVGGSGSRCESFGVTAYRARIDGGSGSPGYFTKK